MNNRVVNWDLYLENYRSLGEAIMNSGGNPFLVLKDFEDLLRILANNDIQIESKYIGLRENENTSHRKELSDDEINMIMNEISKTVLWKNFK